MAKKNHALRRKSLKRAAARQQRKIMDRVHNPKPDTRNYQPTQPPKPPPGG